MYQNKKPGLIISKQKNNNIHNGTTWIIPIFYSDKEVSLFLKNFTPPVMYETINAINTLEETPNQEWLLPIFQCIVRSNTFVRHFWMYGLKKIGLHKRFSQNILIWISRMKVSVIHISHNDDFLQINDIVIMIKELVKKKKYSVVRIDGKISIKDQYKIIERQIYYCNKLNKLLPLEITNLIMIAGNKDSCSWYDNLFLDAKKMLCKTILYFGASNTESKKLTQFYGKSAPVQSILIPQKQNIYNQRQLYQFILPNNYLPIVITKVSNKQTWSDIVKNINKQNIFVPLASDISTNEGHSSNSVQDSETSSSNLLSDNKKQSNLLSDNKKQSNLLSDNKKQSNLLSDNKKQTWSDIVKNKSKF